uniref:Uncharacterized protein n=1 Tax=Theileria annulata TaxID=5874 RepID=A0A3B0MGW3_THEAN
MVTDSDLLVGVKLTKLKNTNHFGTLNNASNNNFPNNSSNDSPKFVYDNHDNGSSNPPKDGGNKVNIWDYINSLEKKNRCLNCEKHHFKNKETKVCTKCSPICKRFKCIHCKEEFAAHKFCKKAEKIYKRTLCLNCAKNIATYNSDPKLCRYCNCWASWRETSECDRCFKFLEKFGNPTNCEMCNKNSSFNTENNLNKIYNNLKLCYLCIYEFKKNDYYMKKKFKKHKKPQQGQPENK